MADNEHIEVVVEETPVVPEVVVAAAPAATPFADAARRSGRSLDRRSPGAGGRGGAGGRPGGNRSNSRRPERKSEYDQRMINIRRVARVVAGGRRFSFSVAIIIGNKKGKVGVGLGKAGDTTLAIDKAVRNAKKNMITVPLTKNNSIPYDTSAKYCASVVSLMPARGRGLVAGSSVRPVLELAGITDIVAKLHSGSKNGLNNARAAIAALKTLKA